MEQSKNKYKILEFGVLVLAIVLFVKLVFGSGGISSQDKTAGAFEWEKEVGVYFVDWRKADNRNCEADVILKRKVPNAETLGPGAMDALIKGLMPNETGLYWSAINPRTLLQKFEIKNKVAYVDFNSSLGGEGARGSCTMIAIRSQIEKTLIDLPDIDSVAISVNGQTEGILEP